MSSEWGHIIQHEVGQGMLFSFFFKKLHIVRALIDLNYLLPFLYIHKKVVATFYICCSSDGGPNPDP